VETFTAAKAFVSHPGYARDRRHALSALALERIDAPIVGLIQAIAALPQCFSLQSCYGHFLWSDGQDQHNLDRLPRAHAGRIDYRIAYLAVCIQNSPDGRELRRAMKQIAGLDPQLVQFGSAEWFWSQHPNTFVLQVEPERFKYKDRIAIDHAEALQIETARDRFFVKLEALLERHTERAD
jgi:hypothetical protein